VNKEDIASRFEARFEKYDSQGIINVLHDSGEKYGIKTALAIFLHYFKQLQYEGDYGTIYYKVINKNIQDPIIHLTLVLGDGDELGEDKYIDYQNPVTKEWSDVYYCTLFSEKDFEEILKKTRFKTTYEIVAESHPGDSYLICDLKKNVARH